MEAFRALSFPDSDPVDAELEEESRTVGAILQSVSFEYQRETLKALRSIESILLTAHNLKKQQQ